MASLRFNSEFPQIHLERLQTFQTLRWFTEGAFVSSVSSAGIPAAPGRPVAQEASSSAVMVHWPPPASSAHCAVSSYTVEYRQEGTPVWWDAGGMVFYFERPNWTPTLFFLPSLAARLAAVAADGQQQGGVRSDRRPHTRRSLPVQGPSLQPLGGRPAVRALQHGDTAQHQ